MARQIRFVAGVLGRGWEPWALLAPALALLGLVVILPLGVALASSLQSMDLNVPSRVDAWVGDLHYRELVHDSAFAQSLGRSIAFALVVTALEIAAGLPLALGLRRAPGRRIAELALLVPLLTAPVVVGLAWLLLLQPDYGIIPWLLGLRIPLLASTVPAFLTLCWVDFWQWTPFVALLCMASLDAVPQTLREAAALDRLGRWRLFLVVEWPFLLPVVGVVAILRFLEAFKVYDTVAVLTKGGPGNATEFVGLFLTKLAFGQTRFGYAAAATVILDYLVILAASFLFLLLTRRRSA